MNERKRQPNAPPAHRPADGPSLEDPGDEKLHVVVIGGGYGGLEVIRRLGKHKKFRKHRRLTLIDKENFFQFTPLLPDVTSGSVETRHIVYPLRDFTRRHGARFVMNKLRWIDPKARRVCLHGGLRVSYDYLVLAMGSETNFFGAEGAREHSLPLKTVMDAIRLRAQIVEMFELADQAEDEEIRRSLLTFVVVGGGVTGIEVASEMMRLVRETLLPRYPNISEDLLTVHLIEGDERLISKLREKHAKIAEKHLKGLGVRIRYGTLAKEVRHDRVVLEDGTQLPAQTVIWTAGIRGVSPEDGWPEDFPIAKNGKLEVDAEGRVPGHPRIFAIGDLAVFPTQPEGDPAPAVAQGAIQTGKVVARNILADVGLEDDTTRLDYRDYGYIVGLGRHSTVATVLGIPISGFLAWYFWAAYYLFIMVGFQKQLEVFLDHVKGFFFSPDISQIHDRRSVLREKDVEVPLTRARREAAGEEVPLDKVPSGG